MSKKNRLKRYQVEFHRDSETWKELIPIFKKIGAEGMKDLLSDNKDFVMSGMVKECGKAGIDPDTVDHLWYKSKHYSIHSKVSGKSYEDIRDSIVAEMKAYAPKYKKLKRDKVNDPCLLIVDPADVHLGKLCSHAQSSEPYNVEIAKDRFIQGVLSLIERAKPYNIEKIIFVGGNDILHVDGKSRTTTKGTPQDTDGMWFDNFQKAKDLYIWAIETLMQLADVHFVFCPSNHDYHTGYFLADSVKSWFHNSDNVTFDNGIPYYKYVKYGNTLLGFTHGDGAKPADLPNKMKSECKEAWCHSDYGIWFLHHFHHKIKKSESKKLLEKDHGDVRIIRANESDLKNKVHVEYVNSISGSDSWHHIKNYEGSPQQMEAFLIHPVNGYFARFAHGF